MTTLQQAAEQVLEALEASNAFVEASANAKLLPGWGEQLDLAERAASALRQALEAEQQAKPVYQLQRPDGLWRDQDKQAFDYNASHGWPTRILYTHPQPAQWVGLTDDDIDPDHPFIDSIRAIEAKLREKNANPQPAQQPTHWISDTRVSASPHTVSDEMYQRGRKAGAYEGYTPMFARPQPAQQHQVDHQQKTSNDKDLRVKLQESVTSSAPAAAPQSGGIPPDWNDPENIDSPMNACMYRAACKRWRDQAEPVGTLSIEVTGPRTKIDFEWGDRLLELNTGNHKLYLCPQTAQQQAKPPATGLNLNCRSEQKRLATLWGFAPAQQPLTDERITEIANQPEVCWGDYLQALPFARAIEREIKWAE